jgi:hypothetical protein
VDGSQVGQTTGRAATASSWGPVHLLNAEDARCPGVLRGGGGSGRCCVAGASVARYVITLSSASGEMLSPSSQAEAESLRNRRSGSGLVDGVDEHAHCWSSLAKPSQRGAQGSLFSEQEITRTS